MKRKLFAIASENPLTEYARISSGFIIGPLTNGDQYAGVVIACHDGLKMVHPQFSELTQHLTDFLRGNEDDQLVVYDPEGNAQVDFLYRDEGEPCLRLILTDPTSEELNAAHKLALPEPEETLFTQRYGQNRGSTRRKLWYWIPISDPSAAAELALSIHFRVWETRPDTWLWITPIPEPDQWPVPLPKPPVWPPA